MFYNMVLFESFLSKSNDSKYNTILSDINSIIHVEIFSKFVYWLMWKNIIFVVVKTENIILNSQEDSIKLITHK